MFTVVRTTFVVVLASLLLTSALTACKGKTMREQALTKGVDSIERLSTRLDQITGDIDAALATAADMQTTDADRQALARQLEREINDVDERAEATRRQAVRMRTFGDRYFEQWERDFALGRAGAEDVETSERERQRYRQLTDYMTQAGDNFRTLHASLLTVRDLAEAGAPAEELSNAVARSRQLGLQAQAAIDRLQEQLDAIVADYEAAN